MANHKVIVEYVPDYQVVANRATAELLFAIEAALPFVKDSVGSLSCSSSGGPVALTEILRRYNWAEERANWLFDSRSQGFHEQAQ